jgi:hypothetical protein
MQQNPEQRAERLRRLVALEVARIVDGLESRRDFLLRMWGRHRDRQPFLDTIHNRWKTIGFPDLALLDPEEVAAVDGFFAKLDEFKLYVSYTQDMPTSMAERYDFAVERLRAWAEVALEQLGGAPEGPSVFDSDDRAGFLLSLPESDVNNPGHEPHNAREVEEE